VCKIGLVRGLHQRLSVRLVFWVLAGVGGQFFANVFQKAPVVEIAFGILKMVLQKFFVPALDQHVKAEIASIQLHSCVRGARHGHAGLEKGFSGELFADIGWILDGVIEAELLQSMKALPVSKLVKVQSEGGFVVNRSEAAGRALQMESNVCVNQIAFANGGLN